MPRLAAGKLSQGSVKILGVLCRQAVVCALSMNNKRPESSVSSGEAESGSWLYF